MNISSGTPFRGVPFLLHYVTSKGAIVAFTRSLARELGKDEIHVNCVAPGFTMSDGVKAHPEVIDALQDVSVAARTIQRDQLPEDVVGAVVFLCTPEAGFITGQTMVIDGGTSIGGSRCTSGRADETEAGPRVVYDLEQNEAWLGAARVDGPALVWEVGGDATERH